MCSVMNPILINLKVMCNCLKVNIGFDHAFNLAANMGGMRFIQSNHPVFMMISFDLLGFSMINGD